MRSASPSSPKRLAFPGKPSVVACIAAAQCGLDEAQVATKLMDGSVMAATRVFDFIQEPDYTRGYNWPYMTHGSGDRHHTHMGLH